MNQNTSKSTALWRRGGGPVLCALMTICAAFFVTTALTGQSPASWYAGGPQMADFAELHVLLVDDDDNDPDVRDHYVKALDGLRVSYEIWDTGERGTGPLLDQLDAFDAIIWFTGASNSPDTGPSAEEEAALEAWLDRGRLLLISSQDYNWARKGPTDLMVRSMGVASVTDDDGSSREVRGTGGVFEGLGPLRLEHGFEEYADAMEASRGATGAFRTETGACVGVLSRSRGFGTLYLGFPFEAIATERDRREVFARFFLLGDPEIFEDGFESGDTSAWSAAFPPIPTPTPTSTATATATQVMSFTPNLTPTISATPTWPQPTPTITTTPII